jgi:hypothetical protein
MIAVFNSVPSFEGDHALAEVRRDLIR